MMGAQLETVVANCNVCARYRREQRREPLQVSTLPERPWQRVAADLFQLRDVHYLLVVDYYPRFPEDHRLSDLYSNRIVDGLKQVFSRHGIPSELHTDNYDALSVSKCGVSLWWGMFHAVFYYGGVCFIVLGYFTFVRRKRGSEERPG